MPNHSHWNYQDWILTMFPNIKIKRRSPFRIESSFKRQMKSRSLILLHLPTLGIFPIQIPILNLIYPNHPPSRTTNLQVNLAILWRKTTLLLSLVLRIIVFMYKIWFQMAGILSKKLILKVKNKLTNIRSIVIKEQRQFFHEKDLKY